MNILFLCLFAAPAALGFDNLDTILGNISTGKIQSVEDLVETSVTHESTQDLLLRFPVVMYKSNSAQFASDANPRVIFYNSYNDYFDYNNVTTLLDVGLDRTFIALTTDPTAPGFQTAEIMQYHSATREFEFREIEFSEIAGVAPRVSGKNPQTCAACHGTPLRPIWSGYGIWPGSLGSGQQTHTLREAGIYQNLIQRSQTERRLSPIQKMRKEVIEASGVNSPAAPNLSLGDAIGQAIVHKMAADLAAIPNVTPYRFTIVGSLLGCQFQNLFPESEWNRLGGEVRLRTLFKDTYDRNVKYFDSNFALYTLDDGLPYQLEEDLIYTYDDQDLSSDTYYGRSIYKQPARLKFFLEPLGIDLNQWKTRIGGKSDDDYFQFGYSTLRTLASKFADVGFPAAEAPLVQAAIVYQPNPPYLDCDFLETQSRAALGGTR